MHTYIFPICILSKIIGIVLKKQKIFVHLKITYFFSSTLLESIMKNADFLFGLIFFAAFDSGWISFYFCNNHYDFPSCLKSM